jgi:rhamnogalacturonyl hydrolase YesR
LQLVATASDETYENAYLLALDSIRRLDGWLERHHYSAYDAFDGLNAWVRPLAFGRLGRQFLQQCVRRFPINLRPLLGIHPSVSSKGFGYLARGYLKLYRIAQEKTYLEKAVMSLDWLKSNASRDYGGLSWGNHFDYQSRVFYLPRGTPTIVWVAHIGHAFVDAWETTHREEYLNIAREACEFILTGLERRPEGNGVCLSYLPGQYRPVHNANMLGAALLARVYQHTGREDMRAVARDAVDYTVGAQLPDGAWWYGEAKNLRWVDNFHTGYVLDSLWWYLRATGDSRHAAAFERGADYYVSTFFLDDGTPKYYARRIWPLDIQCAAQAIETLVLLSHASSHASIRVLARKVAMWSIAKMQDSSGYFYFQRLPLIVNRTPTLHWGQSTMLHALASLVLDRNQDGK